MAYILKDAKKVECLQCGKEVYGRQDKKFCSERCKNTFHNQAISLTRRMKAETLAAISDNYDILNKLEKEKIRSISIGRIKEMGFNETVSTGHRGGMFNHQEEYCFDIAYYRTSQKIFNIHRRQSPCRPEGPNLRPE